MVPSVTPLIRKAQPQDGDAILQLVCALADYEKLDRPDQAAQVRLLEDLFRDRPRLEAWIAELDGVPVGYAFVFETYSSFLALPTLYLEDLFVLPEYRSRKIGYGLFQEILTEARRRGCGRMEWQVLDWNAPAIDFYERLGATHNKAWLNYRITLPE